MRGIHTVRILHTMPSAAPDANGDGNATGHNRPHRQKCLNLVFSTALFNLMEIQMKAINTLLALSLIGVAQLGQAREPAVEVYGRAMPIATYAAKAAPIARNVVNQRYWSRNAVSEAQGRGGPNLPNSTKESAKIMTAARSVAMVQGRS